MRQSQSTPLPLPPVLPLSACSCRPAARAGVRTEIFSLSSGRSMNINWASERHRPHREAAMPGGTAIDNESEPEGGELAPIHVTSAPALASSSTAVCSALGVLRRSFRQARGSSLLSSPPMAARLNIRRLGRRSASLLPRPPSRPFPGLLLLPWNPARA
ncbi:hypothetical protein VTN96DRAFT_1661 [Rasamsonia emersonii]